MFKRSQRFSFKTGVPKQKLVAPLFMVRFQKTEEPHYGVVVSKAVSKKAVHRNHVKRVFIKTLQEQLSKKPISYTLVFFLRQPYTEYSKSVIITELQNLFEKLT